MQYNAVKGYCHTNDKNLGELSRGRQGLFCVFIFRRSVKDNTAGV